MSRFDGGAQATCALNHPNICTIYEIGGHGGQPLIAMEFLDEQILKHCISGKPLPLEQVLELGLRLPSGLRRNLERKGRGSRRTSFNPTKARHGGEENECSKD